MYKYLELDKFDKNDCFTIKSSEGAPNRPWGLGDWEWRINIVPKKRVVAATLYNNKTKTTVFSRTFIYAPGENDILRLYPLRVGKAVFKSGRIEKLKNDMTIDRFIYVGKIDREPPTDQQIRMRTKEQPVITSKYLVEDVYDWDNEVVVRTMYIKKGYALIDCLTDMWDNHFIH